MAELPSGLSDAVADEEDLARFLTSRREFNGATVKPAAFMPNPADGKKSVYRHGAEPRASLWRIADAEIGGRAVYGAGIVRAADVRAARLEVAASEPPLRHADLVGWASPGPDPELSKAIWKEQALEIAQKAQLVLR